MLSIFEQKELEAQAEKRPALHRLQHVLGEELPTAAEDNTAAAAAVEQPPIIKTAPAVPLTWERKAAAPQKSEAPPPVAASPGRADAVSAEFQQFAEQFARNFLEGLTRAVKDVHTLVTEDRRRLEAAFEIFTRSSREAEALRSEVANTCQKVDSLMKGQQELATRLGKAEDALSIFTSATNSIQDLQQQLEKRLEVQAGVIRTLHNGMQSRDERVDKLLTTFKALQSVAGEAASSARSLPDNL